ncbi:Sec23/Sec24 family protein [Talaromyces proteolyticus]|uniref:Sec23/Sec24 family protein n=1 Tax=Talaromyces proteolyticus TaxID=1131652 RepID=A0AAD4KQ67_9EURO|nr:Sec23/Sec24 family protein [Talaromyces proteolyticus]KAH8693024.1 Sec23/Sec24 family protein [Talaromyces proteolyticus]
MSGYSTDNAIGHPVAPGEDPNRQQQQPGHPTSVNPYAAYQHPAAPYGPLQPQQFAGQPGTGYLAGSVPPAPGAPEGNTMAGLASQMGGLGIASDAGARGHKKKHRHAYHDIGGPAGGVPSPQGLGAFPPQNEAATSQFLNTGLNQPVTQQGAQPALGQPANPAMGIPTQPGYQSTEAGSVPTQGKIDPEQIPSVPRSRDMSAQYYHSHVYPTMEQHVPPPASIPFITHDQGNSSPKFARLTLNNIPATSEFFNSTGLPMGLILQPLARLDAGEQPVPLIDFGELGPPRCRRCRTYINPFMTFRSGGNKFICNMCTFPNDVTLEYFAPVDPSGIRVDRAQRPELMMGTVEFTVPKEYWVKEPVGLQQLFLIDVSQESVNKGFLEGVCQGIINALYGEDADTTEDNDGEPRNLPEGSKIGIVTFDREIHFYNLSARLEKAQMMVMTDLEEPFVPLSEGLFVDPYESKAVITSLLEQLPTLFSHIKYPEPALLPTIKAALAALQATGGKIICSLSRLPTYGPGKLAVRDKNQFPDGETRLFAIDNAEWKSIATKLAESGVGIDFFAASPGGAFMDLTTIGYAAAISGGETFFYPNFHAPRDLLKLSQEIAHTVTRETGYQALMKVRCSNGLQVSSYHGNFLQHTFGADLEIGTVDADKALGVLFSYDGKLDPKLDAHFQAALLYTSASGQRRVRCINIVAAVNEGGLETMKCIDQDAVVSIIAKEAASKAGDKPLKDIRASITEKTVDIFSGYRKNFSGSHPPGQLVLPENLKEFSMYMLGMIKSRAFKGGSETADRRVHDLRMLRSIGCLETSLYLYPRILPIHNMRPEDGFANEQGRLQVPPALRATFSRIEEGGVYLVDNGQVVLLWLHAQVSPNLLEDLFGPGFSSLQSLDANTSSLPVLETHLNAQVRNLLQYLSTVRGSKAVTIQLARQGLDGAEFEFARSLVEDRNNEAQSYVDWLVHIHRQINLELAGHRKKEEGTGSGEGALSSLTGIRAPYW